MSTYLKSCKHCQSSKRTSLCSVKNFNKKGNSKRRKTSALCYFYWKKPYSAAFYLKYIIKKWTQALAAGLFSAWKDRWKPTPSPSAAPPTPPGELPRPLQKDGIDMGGCSLRGWGSTSARRSAYSGWSYGRPLGLALILYQFYPSQIPRHHVIASRSSAKAPAEQLAPPLAEEGRFGEWLSRHASFFTSLKVLPNAKVSKQGELSQHFFLHVRKSAWRQEKTATCRGKAPRLLAMLS